VTTKPRLPENIARPVALVGPANLQFMLMISCIVDRNGYSNPGLRRSRLSSTDPPSCRQTGSPVAESARREQIPMRGARQFPLNLLG
jgi:hypothetical protein